MQVGQRGREMAFELCVTARGHPERGVSAADVLDPPLLATSATGIIVVPAASPLTCAPRDGLLS